MPTILETIYATPDVFCRAVCSGLPPSTRLRTPRTRRWTWTSTSSSNSLFRIRVSLSRHRLSTDDPIPLLLLRRAWRLSLVGSIIAALQRGTIVVAARVRAWGATLVAGRGAAQAGLAPIFLVNHFVTVFDGRKPRFYVVKLRGRNDVLRARRKNGRNLLLRRRNAIRSLRVRSECFGDCARLLLFFGLNLFKEADEGLRVVSRLIHVLQPQIVCFRLKIALELHERQRQAQAGGFVDSVADAASNEDKRNGADVRPLRARHLASAVACRNVRNLMRHHARQFSLFIGRQNQAGVYIEKATGQRERVHFIGIDDLDGKRNLGIGIAHQILSDAVHVFRDHRVLHQLHRALDLHGVLFAHSDFGFERIPVAQTAAANLAIADGVDIVFAAVMLDLARIGLLNGSLRIGGRVSIGARRRVRSRSWRGILRRRGSLTGGRLTSPSWISSRRISSRCLSALWRC